MMLLFRSTLVQLCFALLFGSLMCAEQAEIEKVLEMPFPEKSAEIRNRILAIGAEGAPFVTQDIIESNAASGMNFARKSFLVDVMLHYQPSVARPQVQRLLLRENNAIVVMITIRRIAYDRRSKYIDDLVQTLDDLRVGRTIGHSHYPDQPVTIRAEAIEALEKIVDLKLGDENASEEKKAELWRAWAAKRIAE